MINQAKDVVTYIEQQGLSLIPEVFSVIYDAFLGNNRFLLERLETIEELGPPSDETIKALYKDYIFQKQLHATIIAEEEVSKTLDIINRVHSRLEETTQALDNIQETLEIRSKIVSDIDSSSEIEMLKDTLSHDINTLIYEINDSNLWIKYRQKMIKTQLADLKSQQRIHYQDCLTSLPNKFFLKQKLAALSTLTNSSHNDERIYLGKLTLDNLKIINQMHGRPIGDAVLRKLGKNMSQVIPEDWEVFRVNGNDFAIAPHHSATLNDVTMRMIALKKTFSGKKFKSKLSDEPIVMSLGVKTITLHRATAHEDVFEELLEKSKRSTEQ